MDADHRALAVRPVAPLDCEQSPAAQWLEAVGVVARGRDPALDQLSGMVEDLDAGILAVGNIDALLVNGDGVGDLRGLGVRVELQGLV